MEPTGYALANSSNSIVVLVDYGNISSCNYERTVEEIVPSVGIYLAEFIRSYDLDPNKIELVGHSLGAHVAGYTGASMNGTIFRITGKVHRWNFKKNLLEFSSEVTKNHLYK